MPSVTPHMARSPSRGISCSQCKAATTHHSRRRFKGKWWLFYHDVQLSVRTICPAAVAEITELKFNADGTIQMIDPFTN